VGAHRDDPHGTGGEVGQQQGVVARVDLEVTVAVGVQLRPQPGRLGGIPDCVLDCHDALVRGQLDQRRSLDAPGRAAGNVVADHGHLRGLREGEEVRPQRVLRGLGVVGSNDQAGVHPDRRRVLGERNGLGRVVSPGAGDDRGRVPDLFADVFEECQFLRGRQRRRLTGRAAYDQALRRVLDEVGGQATGGLDIE
jgi:hypothetical protein